MGGCAVADAGRNRAPSGAGTTGLETDVGVAGAAPLDTFVAAPAVEWLLAAFAATVFVACEPAFAPVGLVFASRCGTGWLALAGSGRRREPPDVEVTRGNEANTLIRVASSAPISTALR